MAPQVKALTIEDLTAEGQVEAKVAQLGVVDRDLDITEPGYFGKQATRMVWGHQWLSWIGKGTIYEDGDAAMFSGQFFMDTQAGAEAYKTVKAMGELAEWSYGYEVLPGGSRKAAPDSGARRVLQPRADGTPGATVFEVSPVLQAAGVGTGTTAIKGDAWVPGEPLPTDQKFSDQLQATVVSMQRAIARAQAIKELREDEGKPLGQQTVELLGEMNGALEKLQGTVAALLPTTEQAPPEVPPADEGAAQADALRAAHAHLEQLVAGLP